MKNIIQAAIILLLMRTTVYGIEITNEKLTFGELHEGQKAELSYEIKNNSDKPVEVGIRPSCECITVEPQRTKIEPGAKRAIRVNVNTSGYSGIFKKDIYIQSSDLKKPYVVVKVSGQVLAAKQINPVGVKKSVQDFNSRN